MAVLAACGTGGGTAQGAVTTAAAAAKPAASSTSSSSSASPAPKARPTAKPTTAASPRTTPVVKAAPAPAAPSPDPDARLAAALDSLRRTTGGHFSLALTDLDRGTTATYAPDGHAFVTASIAKADILATLLLRAQDSGQPLSADDRAQARKMIEASDNTAADTLWGRIGGGAGMATANRRFGLRETVPGPGGQWGLTTTTAADQLRLLNGLTSAASPLNAASRSYELGLMGEVRADQNWGVSAAAAPAASTEVKNGWLPRTSTGLWVVNSIGVVERDADGHRLLIVALSDDQPSYASGVGLVQSLTTTAVRALRAA